MKRKVSTFVMFSFMAGSLAMTSCNNSKENKKEAAEPMQNEMHQEKAKTEHYKDKEVRAEFKDETTAKLYGQYIAIKDALVNTDAESAKNKAEALAQNEASEEMRTAAKAISDAADVNKQREAFSKLTSAMEVELEDALASGEIYKQFCPMAFEGEGDYWFANSKAIYNPYFGDQMLNCGRVDATIK